MIAIPSEADRLKGLSTLADFTSFVDRLVGTAQKAPRLAGRGQARAKWLASADAVFSALTELILSTLIFLTIGSVLAYLGSS